MPAHFLKRLVGLSGVVLATLFLSPLVVELLSKGVVAHFSPIQSSTHVFIDGIDFGSVSLAEDLETLAEEQSSSNGQGFKIVQLGRTFVTDPSIYAWAQQTVKTRPGLSNIELVERDKNGMELSRKVLVSKPLKWTVEEADQASGGFYENIELAVQKITSINPTLLN